ncbi:hypothetical protein EK21DRAFT_84198 [Setomelanomma holmii]|uniref:Uncharacterized protein n=1 Tax=Setomelanomma holmii TaxID=210430 RepID=A0A9P4LSQ4_9PLEO|nr:hypothetical protein EK21DRAFT_84198 [Setomelanomma holmii]
MEQHRNGHEDGYQPELVVVSPDRPPQFNGSNCGFRCGLGCEPSGEDDDGGGSESGTPTLINSVDEEEDDDDDDVRERPQPREEYEAAQRNEAAVEAGFEGMHHPVAYVEGSLYQDQVVVVDEDTSMSSLQYQSFDDVASLEPEASSGAHSVLSLDGRIIEVASPDRFLTGIRDWIDDITSHQPLLDTGDVDQAGQMPPNPLFRVPPLRLSPQYEHCRGNPYSHMVLPALMMEQ